MKKIVVTGGEGFIGQALLSALSHDNKCYSIDIVEEPKQVNYQYIQCNVGQEKIVSKLLDLKPDVIFHLAAQTASIISEETPHVDVETNINGALNIYNAVMGLSDTTLVFTSSMAVYGAAFNEYGSGPQAQPSSIYGISKLASEFVFKRLSPYNKKFSILRLFNVYGEGQNLSNLKQGMVSIYAAMALKDKEILIKGGRNRSRDFVHVTDVVDALIDGMNHTTNDIIDVGTGREIFVYEIVELIQQNCKQLFQYDIKAIYDKGFKEDILRSKATKPYKHSVDFERGLKSFLIWCNKEINND